MVLSVFLKTSIILKKSVHVKSKFPSRLDLLGVVSSDKKYNKNHSKEFNINN